MKPDQERVNNLLRDTVTLLCKNGLTYTDELRVEALIGVTVDSNDVFLVHINEKFGPGGETKVSGAETEVNSENSNKESVQPPSNSGASSTKESNSHITPQQSPAHSAQTQRTGSVDSVSSPSWAKDSNSQIDLTKVKLEQVENESECFVVKSPQAVAKQARFVAGQRRGHNRPFLYSQSQGLATTLNQDDTQAMQQQYSAADLGESSALDYDLDSGEPPPKLKRPQDENDLVSNFYGGESDQGSVSDTSQSQWPNLSDISAQQTFQSNADSQPPDNSLLPSCSSWPALPGGTQRGGMGQGAAVPDMGHPRVHSRNLTGSQRRGKPLNPTDKPHKCVVDGCEKRFYYRRDARRHERQVHSIIHTKGTSSYKADCSLESHPATKEERNYSYDHISSNPWTSANLEYCYEDIQMLNVPIKTESIEASGRQEESITSVEILSFKEESEKKIYKELQTVQEMNVSAKREECDQNEPKKQ